MVIKAIGTIQVGDKTYAPGKVVYGLSDRDIKWMQEDGMIQVIEDTPQNQSKKQKGSDTKQGKE